MVAASTKRSWNPSASARAASSSSWSPRPTIDSESSRNPFPPATKWEGRTSATGDAGPSTLDRGKPALCCCLRGVDPVIHCRQRDIHALRRPIAHPAQPLARRADVIRGDAQIRGEVDPEPIDGEGHPLTQPVVYLDRHVPEPNPHDAAPIRWLPSTVAQPSDTVHAEGDRHDLHRREI